MIKKRFYFNVGDTDEGRISLVRGFFYGYLKNLENQGIKGIIECDTLEETSSCKKAASHEVPAKDKRQRKHGGTDTVYTDPDNTEGKEAYIEFDVDEKVDFMYDQMISHCNKLIKLDEG